LFVIEAIVEMIPLRADVEAGIVSAATARVVIATTEGELRGGACLR
jgi:hypothetical protein